MCDRERGGEGRSFVRCLHGYTEMYIGINQYLEYQ